MDIGFIGVGKLGMPCALAIDMKGHNVICYDVVEECMQKETFPHREVGPNGESSIEPLLRESSLEFGSMRDVLGKSEIVFVAIQTPHHKKYEGTTRLPEERVDFDYKYLVECMENISKIVDEINEDKIVILISTVLPGTLRREVFPVLSDRVKLCYNPFFIAMGTTIPDFLDPEFVLFGVDDENAALKAEEFYKTIHGNPFYKTTIESAELIKVAYNTFISSKIAIVNTLMEICHHIPGANIDDVTGALKIATDRLISPKYMDGGMGDGGSCHPRDNIALSWLSRDLNLSYDWFENIMLSRECQSDWFVDLILDELGDDEEVFILGKSFKPETNLLEGSPSILLANLIEEYQYAEVHFIDPHVDGTSLEPRKMGKALYFVGTKHECFKGYTFEEGSVVIDPFRYIEDQPGVKVIRIGE